MKNVLAMMCVVFCIGALRADETEELVNSYSLDRRGYQWERITSANRQSVVALLKELQSGKRSTVLGGSIVVASTAEEMLIDIGDDETIRAVVSRYHTKERGPTNITQVVELGQALAIPYLAVDFVSDKYHYYYEAIDTDGRVERVMDGDKAYDTARNIVLIATNSRQLPEAVRVSAKAFLKQFSPEKKEAIISQMTAWWRQNEPWFATQRFDRVALLPQLQTEVAAPDAHSAGSPHLNLTDQAVPRASPARLLSPIRTLAPQFHWSWFAGGGVAIALLFFVILRSRWQ